MNEFLAGVAYFVFVFFKAAQQRNVAFLNYRWVLPTSYLMASTEVFVISIVAHHAVTDGVTLGLLWFAAAIGTGGGLGAIAAMYLHNRYIR